MNREELFIESYTLPNPLAKEETYKLLEEIKKGNQTAKQTLIIHNIRLVLYEVSNKFKYIEYEKKDLVSIGIIGLIQAINNFDLSKNISFSTFAVKCIDNKIKDFLRKSSNNINSVSLYSKINNEDEITLIEILSADTDIQEDYLNKEIKEKILKIVNDLPERNQKIIKMYFGFYDNKKYKQKEIAEILNLSRQTVSSVVVKSLKQIKNYLVEIKVIETKVKSK